MIRRIREFLARLIATKPRPDEGISPSQKYFRRRVRIQSPASPPEGTAANIAMSLSLEEKACNFDTMRHIERVRNLLNAAACELLRRGEEHDQSKLEPPEVGLFMELTPKLAASTYGSPEYDQFRKALGPALAHHYAKNRHHPEHHKNGVDDMTLVDLVEMLCDWKAASERHHDGNILKSIEVNADRFRLSPQLVRILENTAKAMGYL